MSMGDAFELRVIGCDFQRHFKVKSLVGSASWVLDTGDCLGDVALISQLRM